MLADLLLALLFLTIFLVAGAPFALYLAGSARRQLGYPTIALAGVLGMAAALIGASNLLAVGVSLRATAVVLACAWVALLAGLVAVWIRLKPFVPAVTPVWVAQRVGLVVCLVAGAAVLLSSAKSGGSILNFRLGIDSAMYGDTAQVLLEGNGGVTGFEAMSAASPTGFGPAALMVHMRWGTPILLALFTQVTWLAHSYQVVVPLLAVTLGLSAAISIAIARRVGLSRPISLVVGFVLLFSYPLLHLSLEGQWPQAMALPLVLATFLVWLRMPSRGSRREMAMVVLELALLLAASTMIYSEYLPILLVIFALGSALLFARRQSVAAWQGLVALTGGVLVAAVLVAPYTLRLVPHLLGLTLVGVGYETPLLMLPTEVIGLGSIWSRWGEWITAGSMPTGLERENPIRDLALALIVAALYAYGTLWIARTSREWSAWVATFMVVVGLGLYFAVFKHSGYLWSKGIVTLAPLVLVAVIVGLMAIGSSSRRWHSVSVGLLVALSVYIVFTGINGIRDFKASSRALTSDVLEVREFMRTAPPCITLLRPRGLTAGGFDAESYSSSPTRQSDRVLDFGLVPVFREDPVLDSWSMDPIAYQGDLADVRERVCVIVNTNMNDIDLRALTADKRVLFLNDHWAVLDGGVTLDELRARGADDFYAELFQGVGAGPPAT